MNPICDIDWRELWIERDRKRKLPDGPEYWDGRAHEFSRYHEGDQMSKYSDTFLSYLGLAPGESVFDMGCGNGGIALPLARAGHPVVACDFSPKMLEVLTGNCVQSGIKGITTHLMAWTDDWESLGVTTKCVDVAVASRSIMVQDLWAALERLSSVARRKVAITLATDFGPHATCRLGDIVDGISYLPDYLYALNMVIKMGYQPELRYIKSVKKDKDGDFRLIRWAFISWDLRPQ